MHRRHVLIAALAVSSVTALASAPAVAADYPRRPINIVVPYGAGGGVDTYARALAAAADGIVEVPLVVVNKPGSGGLNGAQSVKGARPDGYTVMLTSGGSFLLSTLTRDTDINALETFDFVAQVGALKTSLMVPANSPFESVQDVIDAAQAEPGALRWAHSGRGGFHHVGGLGFLAKNGIEAQDVPFKGGGPTRAALIGEQADYGFLGIQQLSGFEQELRALAVNADERDAVMSDVPSMGELGIPFAAVSSPVVMLAPAGTPEEVIVYLEGALEQITSEPGFAETLAQSGTAPAFATGSETEATLVMMKADVEPLVVELTN